MKILHLSIITILIAVSISINAASAEQYSVILTPFDISFSEKDFTRSGPSHQILILKPNETASITIKVNNHDTVQHEISFSIPQNISDFVDSYFFEPSTITDQPNSEQQVLLHIKTKEKTETHWSTVPLVAQSKNFGMIGKYFYLVIGDKSKISELDPFIDHSMREDMPGPAFPQVVNDFPAGSSELLQDLDKIMPRGFAAPRYLPSGYSFQGTYLPAPLVGLLYAPIKITNATESIDFWRSGGILIYSEPNSPNFNLASWMTTYSAQNEAKQIMINGMMGVATEQQERVVVDGPKYKFPAEIILFGKNTEIELRGNIPLDELVRVASSMHQDKSIIYQPSTIAKTITLSPLKQFKSGISAKDVKCKESLVLVIKNGGIPICVKPTTVDKLFKRGILQIETTVQTAGSQCNTEFKPKPFEHVIFPNGTSLTINYAPVFLMKPNSTGKICTNNWRIAPEMNYSGKVITGIGKDSSAAQDVTVIADPDTITIDDTNKTIVYTITASKDSDGFYRFSPMFSNCGGIPMAIGYDSTHSFDNDFPWLGETVPCPLSLENTEITGLTGIEVEYITKEYR